MDTLGGVLVLNTLVMGNEQAEPKPEPKPAFTKRQKKLLNEKIVVAAAVSGGGR